MSRDNARVEFWAQEALQALEHAGLRRVVEPLSSPQGPLVELAGKRLINFSSNDYLGLAQDERLAQAATACMRQFGMGSGASRLVVGDSLAHASLEKALAGFMRSDATRLFNSGYAANVGVLSTLMQSGDVIFSDELNHASVIDGCRMSKATTVVYPHRDLVALERLLKAHPGRRRLMVTDAVFSMDGDCAFLPEWVALAQREGVATMVDEAHAIGVLGETGAGLCEAHGVLSQVDLRVGTLGKAFGSFGAFVAASQATCDWLLNRARSLVFSTALPASVCAASEKAIEIVRSEPERRETLWRNIRYFAEGLQSLGVPAQPQSAVFPWVLGTPERAVKAANVLREQGLLAKPIRPPTVPQGTSRIRFALSAAHTLEQLQLALSAVEGVLRDTQGT